MQNILPNKNRRETWKELVTRNKKMHLKKYPELKDEINKAYKLVYDKKVLPSMRSQCNLQVKPIEISVLIEFIIVHIFLLMIGEHFQKQCFYY
jgi:hypothetical protein